jgi:hypothetical protein
MRNMRMEAVKSRNTETVRAIVPGKAVLVSLLADTDILLTDVGLPLSVSYHHAN